MFCLKKHMGIVGGRGETLCSLIDLFFLELHRYWMSFLTEMFYRQVQTLLQNGFSVCAFVLFAYLCFWGIITLPLTCAAGEGLDKWWEWRRQRCLYYCNSGEKSTKMEVGMKEEIISYRQSMLMCSAKRWISGFQWILFPLWKLFLSHLLSRNPWDALGNAWGVCSSSFTLSQWYTLTNYFYLVEKPTQDSGLLTNSLLPK